MFRANGMMVFNTQRKIHSIPSDGLINWFYFFSGIWELWRKKSAHKCQVLTPLWGTTFQSAVSQQHYVSFSCFIFHSRYPSVFFQLKSSKNIADFWNMTPSHEWVFCVWSTVLENQEVKSRMTLRWNSGIKMCGIRFFCFKSQRIITINVLFYLILIQLHFVYPLQYNSHVSLYVAQDLFCITKRAAKLQCS